MIRAIFFEQLKSIAFLALGCALVALSWGSNAALAQRARSISEARPDSLQNVLYSEYKGVRLGMTAADVRARLGQPAAKADDQDFYMFSDKETAQIAYDATGKVKVISTDYLDGVGAPDYKTVVGSDIQANADGSMYKMVRYQSLGFWVSYNRSAGLVPSVTVTIQKIR